MKSKKIKSKGMESSKIVGEKLTNKDLGSIKGGATSLTRPIWGARPV